MAVLEEQGELGQQHRGEIGPPLVDRFAGLVADEHRVHPQVALQLGRRVGGLFADRERLADLHVIHVGRAADEGRQQLLRHAAVSRQKDAVARLDLAHGIVGRGDLAVIDILPAHALTSRSNWPARRRSSSLLRWMVTAFARPGSASIAWSMPRATTRWI